MSAKGMLSTIDNPFNPIVDFDNWYAEDVRLSRIHDCLDTSSLLARLVASSPYNERSLNDQLLDEVMEQIVRLDPEHRYVIVYEPGHEESVGTEYKE